MILFNTLVIIVTCVVTVQMFDRPQSTNKVNAKRLPTPETDMSDERDDEEEIVSVWIGAPGPRQLRSRPRGRPPSTNLVERNRFVHNSTRKAPELEIKPVERKLVQNCSLMVADEPSAFGAWIAAALRALPNPQALRVRPQLAAILTDAMATIKRRPGKPDDMTTPAFEDAPMGHNSTN